MSNHIFFSLNCLTESSKPLFAIEIHKKWLKNMDKRYPSQIVQKLLGYNMDQFRFLEVTPYVEGYDSELKVVFRSAKFIGAVPIKSPETGKLIGDFLVYPRFANRKDKFLQYTDLISIIGNSLSPEFNDKLELATNINFKPPLYFESIKFIDLLFEVAKLTWKKFKNESIKTRSYKGNVDWNAVIANDFDPESKFNIPTRLNVLTQNHDDFSKIKYVFDIVKSDMYSDRTPIEIRNNAVDKIGILDQKLRFIDAMKTSHIGVAKTDFSAIQNLKRQANVILASNFSLQKAWRIDYSKVFEKVIQYLFKEVGKEIGGTVLDNYRIPRTSTSSNLWELKYLEPDVIFYRNDEIFFIDAKYKSHLLNKQSNSDFLREEFRRDLHQILAYSSFSHSKNKLSFLCYPSTDIQVTVNTFISPLNNSGVKIVMLGVPMEKGFFRKVKDIIKNFILTV